jgi:hypothetical protein
MQLTRAVKIGAAVSGLLTLAALAPIAYAVLSFRSTPESTGVEPGAWWIIGFAVILASLMAAVMGGAFVAVLARALRRLTRRSGP